MLRLRNARPATPVARLAAGPALAVALALVAAACSGGGGEGVAPTTTQAPAPEAAPVPVVTVPPGFTLLDTRGVAVAPFAGRPGAGVPPVDVAGGTSTIAGVVQGPAGPVAGATVLLERFEEDRVGTVLVPTGPDGRFQAPGVHGGRYRIRAWLQPSIATTRSAVTFLAEGEAVEVVVAAERYEAARVVGVVDGAAWEVGGTVAVRASLTRQEVDGNGIVVASPVPDAEVRLDLPAGAAIAAGGSNLARTDGQGVVSWRVECTREGGGEARFVSQVADGAVNLPPCSARTTSTTAAPAAAGPAVGGTLQVPTAGPVAAGTYRATSGGCVTLYEEWDGDGWDDERSSGPTLRLGGPARDLRPGPGTQGCSYVRSA